MPTTAKILQDYGFFANAHEMLRERIMDAAAHANLVKGTHFFQKGETIHTVALLGSGSVRVYIIGDTGREATLYRVRPGETCPINLLCATLGLRAHAHAHVDEDLEAAVIPAQAFRAWINEEPAIRQLVLQALATRMVDILARVEEILFQRIDQRLADYLLQRASEDGDVLAVHATHEQIAFEIGSAREVVTRTLKTFEQSGAIALRRGCIIFQDSDLLRTFGSDASLKH